MRNLYNRIKANLDRLDFDSIWKDFSQYEFALYDDKTAYLENATVPVDRRFLGNTAIDYDGRIIAIWFVDDPDTQNDVELAANIVHEMFHAFQKERGEIRFPDDLAMLGCPDSEAYHTIRHEECRLLAEAFESKMSQEKKDRLMRYMRLRNYRQELSPEIMEQECRAETIEGMAEYAGSMALRQLSDEKYRHTMSEYTNLLCTAEPIFFDVRRMCYYTGTLLCVLLSELGISFYHKVGKEEKTLFELVSEGVKAKEISVASTSELTKAIRKYIDGKEKKFRDFLDEHREEIICEGFISGYDPMNMIRMGDMILCTRFIMIAKDGKSEPEFIEGPVMLRLAPESNNKIKGYIK